MSSFVKFSVKGDAEIIARLRTLQRKAQGQVCRRALRVGSKMIQAEIVERAPRLTGTLAANVKVRSARRRRGRVGMTVQLNAKGNYRGNTFYAPFVAFGWRAGPRRLGDKRRKIPGNPFIQDAVRSRGPAALRAMNQALLDEIARIATGGG